MKVKELIYQTPEMTEEKLLEIILDNLDFFKKRYSSLITRIQEIHKYSDDINKLILKEYDIIQDKKSYLTKSQRDILTGFVGFCMIRMAKGDGRTDDSNRVEAISES